MHYAKDNQTKILTTSLGGLEPPTFRLTAERANRLRHRDMSNAKRRFLFDVSVHIKIQRTAI